MPNWDSRSRKWTRVVREDTKELERRVREMHRSGLSRKEIAARVELTPQRIGELLREDPAE